MSSMEMMQRSTPINALRRDEVQDPQTRDMVDGILNELEYTGGGQQGLPGGGGGFPGEQYEGMHGNPHAMDYGAQPDGGFSGGYGPEFGGGVSGLAPGDPRGGQQFPGDGQYPGGGPQQMHQQYGPPEEQQMPPQEYLQQMQGPPPSVSKRSSGFIGGLSDMFAANSKEPILAAALFLVMSNDTVSTLLSRYIPYASSGMIGLLIRAVLVAALFFVAKIFVLKH